MIRFTSIAFLVLFLSACASGPMAAPSKTGEIQPEEGQGLENELSNTGITLRKEQLEVLERSLPHLHQVVSSEDWVSWNAFDKYRMLSMTLREKWGVEGAFDVSIYMLELARNSFDSTELTVALNIASNSMLNHYTTSERINRNLQKAYGAIIAKHPQIEKIDPSIAGTMMICLNENSNLGDRCSIESESKFRNSIVECVEALEVKAENRVSDTRCVTNASFALSMAFPQCLSKTTQHLGLCMSKIENELVIYVEEQKSDF